MKNKVFGKSCWFFSSSSEKCQNESFDAKSVARVSNALWGASTGFNFFWREKYNEMKLSETRKRSAKSAQFEGKEWSLSALCARYGIHQILMNFRNQLFQFFLFKETFIEDHVLLIY